MTDKPTYEKLEQKVKELEKKDLERQLVEKELHESESKYQDLYDNAPDMFISVDAKTATILDCSRTLANALGYTKEEKLLVDQFSICIPQIVLSTQKHLLILFCIAATLNVNNKRLSPCLIYNLFYNGWGNLL